MPPENAVAGSTSGFVQAAHPSQPQVVKGVGSVLASPKIKVITVTGDPLAVTLNQFVSQFGASTEFAAMTAEYGISAPTVSSVSLSGPAPSNVSDSGIQQTLHANFGSSSPLGNADDQTVYMITFAPPTIVSSNGTVAGDYCLTGTLSYHSTYTDASAGKVITYIVVLRCSPGWGLGDLDSITTAASHEILESVTDPKLNAYIGVAQAFNNWSAYMPGAELGDLCEVFETSFYKPLDLGFAIQRTWSNAAAAAGHNPCVPAPVGAVYFNAIPVLANNVSYIDPNTGTATNATGVTIAVGGSQTIQLKLFSDAPTSGHWTVSAFEDPDSTVSGGKDLTFSFDQTTGSNGSIINLTIHVLQQDPNWLAEPVWIVSELNGVKYYWPFMVGN